MCLFYLSGMFCFVFVFFFKQKTAYEMRISDWSSDVCSSDLQTGYLRDLGKVAQITGLARDAQDTVERAAGDAQGPPRLTRDVAQRLQPRGVRREGRHQPTSRRPRAALEQTGAHRASRSRRLRLAPVGRIASQPQPPIVAAPSQRRAGQG